MNKHLLKTHDTYFQAVWDGLKTAELRFNDRDYKVGDSLVLQEVIAPPFTTIPTAPTATGREIEAVVMHMMTESDGLWLRPGFVMLSFRAYERRLRGRPLAPRARSVTTGLEAGQVWVPESLNSSPRTIVGAFQGSITFRFGIASSLFVWGEAAFRAWIGDSGAVLQGGING